jgi:multicomponent K+:H+ antiporter subunit G
LRDIVLSLLIVIGAAFVLISAIGLVRLPDALSRLHAPTKAATLGVGSLLLASALYFGSLHELLVLIFLFLTAPISAQLLGRLNSQG